MGEFFVEGKLDLTQFYGYVGESDADTAKVQPTRAYYLDHQTGKKTIVKWLGKATVRGRTSKDVIDTKGLLTLRIQWIDAPELHFSSQLKGSHLYRQNFGIRAVDELAKHLLSVSKGKKVVRAVVRTIVYRPQEVFDTYGRCVSTLEVHLGSKVINVNDWLLKHGWALPAFYNSMTPDEVDNATQLANDASKNGRGIWHGFSRLLQPADQYQLFYKDPKKLPTPDQDQGEFNFPKIFRRMVTYHDEKALGTTSATTLHAWLMEKEAKGTGDGVISTSDFVLDPHITSTKPFSDFITDDGKIDFDPASLVFTEADSELLDKETRKKITAWSYS